MLGPIHVYFDLNRHALRPEMSAKLGKSYKSKRGRTRFPVKLLKSRLIAQDVTNNSSGRVSSVSEYGQGQFRLARERIDVLFSNPYPKFARFRKWRDFRD
jgi:hypothetical protein